jgi:hypothetical protein
VLPLLRHRLRRLSMIAFLAIFGLALAPTISHALNHARNASVFNEICSQGMQQMVAGQADTGGDGQAAKHMEHCPLCSLSAAAMAWRQPAPAVAEPLGLGQALPALFLHAPRPLFAWASAQPRAPPALA